MLLFPARRQPAKFFMGMFKKNLMGFTKMGPMVIGRITNTVFDAPSMAALPPFTHKAIRRQIAFSLTENILLFGI